MAVRISGFTYLRNGFDYDVPFIQAINSIIDICDEFIVVLGDSIDGSKEAIQNLNNPKIKIIDTIWDFANNEKGKIFADQTNIGLQACTGDWLFHVQADEVIHENDLPKVIAAINKHHNNRLVEGLLLPFLHFFGGYNYIRTSRRVHKHEIRVLRNQKGIKSYKDSMGFRHYGDVSSATEVSQLQGRKLNVVKVDAPIYHYTMVRPPSSTAKALQLGYFYQDQRKKYDNDLFDPRNRMDRLELFTGTHPRVMHEKVASQDWEFVFDPSKADWRLKDRIMTPLEDLLGFRIGEYKNYKLLKLA
ncbi:MAG: hypothetical protein RL660_3188 [Bacteroidota bacterium]|jgi:glycosyltransferase involved in cell wall biosynthesis